MKQQNTLMMVVVLVLFGLALRLYQLDTVALRGDEAFSANYWAGLPLQESLSQIATLEPHPPLNYAIFRFWGVLFGIDSEFMLRLLPVLVNLAGIPAMYAIGKRLHSSLTGTLAAFLWTIHPFQIWHAQDFRNYAIWSGLSATGLWLALRVIQKRKNIDWLLYFVVTLGTALIFYMELLTAGTVWLFVALCYFHDRQFFWRFTALTAAIVGIVGAAFLLFQGLLVGGGGYAGTTDSLDLIELVTRFLPILNFGDTLPAEILPVIGIILLPVLAISLFIIGRQHQEPAIFLAILAIAPLVMLCVISLRLSIFRPRYVMLASPAYILIFVSAIVIFSAQFSIKWQRCALIFLSISIPAGLSFYSLNNHFHVESYRKAPGWNAFTGYLSSQLEPGDIVIQKSVDASFGYYYHNYYDIQNDEIALPANFDQPASEIERELEQRSRDYRSLWTIGQTFTAWQNYGVVETWLENNVQRTHQTTIAGIPVQQYMLWQVSDTEIENTRIATFGETVNLIGTKIVQPESSEQLYIWLYWHPLVQSDTELKVFVHLAGTINPATNTPLWAQSDTFPQMGRISTQTWQTGEIYRDVHQLDISHIPPGNYLLLTGFYNPETNERLLTDTDEDAFLIGEITIE